VRNAILTLLLFGLLVAHANPAALWEGLMAARLRGNAVGPTEPWTPADLGSDMVMWLSSAATNNMSIVTNQYGDIVSWTNSAPSYPATAFSAASSFVKPSIAYNVINGYPAVLTQRPLDGAKTYGTWSGTNDLAAADGWTSFAVMRLTEIPDEAEYIASYSQGDSAVTSRMRFGFNSSERFEIVVSRDDADSIVTVNSTASATITTNDWLICSGSYDYSAKAALITANGTTVTNATMATSTGAAASDTPSQRVEVFTYAQNANRVPRGYYTDTIVCRRALTAPEVQKLEGWAAHRYALTALLPVDHPYKSAAPTK